MQSRRHAKIGRPRRSTHRRARTSRSAVAARGEARVVQITARHRQAARQAGISTLAWMQAIVDRAADLQIEGDRCVDCDRPQRRRDLYMVEDALWTMYGAGEGLLCLRCLETRMGRRVEAFDLRVCGATLTHPRLRGMIARELRRWPVPRGRR